MKKVLSALLALTLLACALPAMAEGCWYFEKYGDHDYEQVDMKLPTCTTDGYYLLECRQCGYNRKVTTEAYRHEWTITSETTPTCTQASFITYQCSNCHKTRIERGFKLPHTYGSWTTVQPAGDFSAGICTRSCMVCGHRDEMSFYPDGTLYRGISAWTRVRTMQQQLTDLGYLENAEAGQFDRNTEEAVRAYAADNGFPADGIAWPLLLSSLENDWNLLQAGPEAAPAGDHPAHCTRGEDGAWELCARHAELEAEARELLSSAATEEDRLGALNDIGTLWLNEADRLFDAWQESAPEEDQSLALIAKSSFAFYLGTQKQLWEKQYGENSADMLAQYNQALMDECLQLCVMADGE